MNMDRSTLKGSSLTYPLYSASEVQKHEGEAAISVGLSLWDLMQRAGNAAYLALRSRWPLATNILVLCGRGNNGGDGFVLGRLALSEELQVTLCQVGHSEQSAGDAAKAKAAFMAAGGEVTGWQPELLAKADVIVDAMLGTGAKGPLRSPFDEVIACINNAGVPVLAIDIPSGMNADTGWVESYAVHATATICFVGRKLGLFTGSAADHVGELQFNDLGIGAAFDGLVESCVGLVRRQTFNPLIAPRSKVSHKGDYGRVSLVGGDQSYAGALVLAARAALRAGAGLIATITHPGHQAVMLAQQPELMCLESAESDELVENRLNWADVVVVGPGLGRRSWGLQHLQATLQQPQPLVVDADALNLLAAMPDIPYRNNWVLTPHPGEAARLLGCDIEEVEQDRYAAVRALQKKLGGVVVLKGPGTLIYDGQQLAVATVGNPGMASGGMGDILCGIIAALIAQGLTISDAAALAVCIHGDAADMATIMGERGTCATDLLPHIRTLVNP
ncbi:NAD(P)H-hydrate dehydratase [Corallincola luteus]|uniref:Bifunctional NAD(P)H-hydrate repair enzyme n=3 Tax=Psychromonadaceae TaxID=267894 RepID=A0A368NNS6_9GAMM|nr:NAD(P)H-hydrate dehydratase [Corallincola holothuriorum]TCI04661.1 NAD(P)H-hydrate dehydratase [Corallincola luteus]